MNSQEQFLQKFDDASKGVSKYITLDVLEIGIPYEISRFRLLDSVYGRCLIVDLAVGFWLVLPKRIGDLVTTEEQVQLLNSQHYWMIFKGRHEQYRKMAIIEFKTMEQLMTETADLISDMPLVNFALETHESGTILKEIGTQTEVMQLAEAATKTVNIQDEGQQVVKEPTKTAPKKEDTPKINIKTKKEKK